MSRPFATKSTLFETIELIDAGNIDRAEAICRAAVKRNDQDVNMTALLGATLLKAGGTLAEAYDAHRAQFRQALVGPGPVAG